MAKTAKRLDGIGEYYFSQKLREIEMLNKQGRNVINLGIGSPDQPPHPDVIRVLQEQSALPQVHAYQGYKGVAALRNAIAQWYDRWYQVTVDPDTEVLPLIGSKEGIMHICMTYLNEGDRALVPDPGYPTYTAAVKLAGAQVQKYTLKETNDWYPDFEELERLPLENTRLLFVNYPHMPTGQLPSQKVFERLIAFARRHGILIVHDNPYSFILNDYPMSLLSLPGAKDVVLELNSLSKSHNMAGWRVGMLVSNRQCIEEVLRFKSNMDSGMFLPVQLAAAKALSLDASWYETVNETYRERRKVAFALLDQLDCRYSTDQAGMFLWAKVPPTHADGYALSDRVLESAAVFITPGGIFGDAGKGFVRVSLCSPVEKFHESMDRLGKVGK